jgi:hypothetical protein
VNCGKVVAKQLTDRLAEGVPRVAHELGAAVRAHRVEVTSAVDVPGPSQNLGVIHGLARDGWKLDLCVVAGLADWHRVHCHRATISKVRATKMQLRGRCPGAPRTTRAATGIFSEAQILRSRRLEVQSLRRSAQVDERERSHRLT